MKQRLLFECDQYLRLVLPPHCIICGHPVRTGKVCSFCLPQPQFLKAARCRQCFHPLSDPSLDHCELCQTYYSALHNIRYLWTYDTVARDFIRTMKYGPSPALLNLSARLFSEHWRKLRFDKNFTYLIPLPSSRSRLILRGMHHTYYLARKLKKYCAHLQHVPCIAALNLKENTRAQTDLQTRRQRIANMIGAFTISNPEVLLQSDILLIDDVLTTGASVESAARVLIASGVRSVSALALAVTPNFYGNRNLIHSIFSRDCNSC